MLRNAQALLRLHLGTPRTPRLDRVARARSLLDLIKRRHQHADALRFTRMAVDSGCHEFPRHLAPGLLAKCLRQWHFGQPPHGVGTDRSIAPALLGAGVRIAARLARIGPPEHACPIAAHTQRLTQLVQPAAHID